MNQFDIEALPPVGIDQRLGQVGSFIGGVIQNLDLEQVSRIVKLYHGVDQPFYNQRLIENRQLDGHGG